MSKEKIGFLEKCYRALDKATGRDSHPIPIPDSDLRISVAHLREVLEKCCEAGYINQYSRDRIIEIVKSEL